MKKARQKQARRELTRCFFHKNHMLFIAALAVGIAINCSNLLFSYLIQRITDVAMGHDIAPLWRLLMITAVGIAVFLPWNGCGAWLSRALLPAPCGSINPMCLPG